MISIQFVGRLGGDAELRTTPNGKTVLNFSVGADTGWGDRKKTTWVRCALWGDTRGPAVEMYLKKGTKVTVFGDASLRSWESNGKSGTDLECNVQDVDWTSSDGAQAAEQAKPAATPTQEAQTAPPGPDAPPDDDIPF